MRNLLRLSTASLFLLLFTASAYSQNQYAYAGNRTYGKINFTADVPNKQTLLSVLKDLNRQKGVYFLYSEESIGNKMVTPVKDVTENIENILNGLLDNTGLKYKKVSGNTYVILVEGEKFKAKKDAKNAFIVNDAEGQDKFPAADPVRGRITNSEGAAMSGVSVTVKGTSRGTTTNNNGEFVIEASRGDVLVVSYVGFQAQEITVGNESAISLSLTPQNNGMTEVFVTALGVRKEARKLGYSVTKVSGESLTQAREVNVANGLVGKVSGVNVNGVASGPGGSASVTIRGVNDFRGTGPLYVINGIPMDNSNRGSAGMWGGADLGDGIGNINPDDIEEISVLKGSAASALYGSRASGGVVLITTKSGKNKKGIGVEFNSNLVADQAIDFTDFQQDYGQGALGLKPTSQANAFANGTGNWGGKIDGSNVIQFDGVSRPYSGHPDNFKNFYRTGTTLTNTIALSGGNENGNFRLSASDLRNFSIVPNSGLNRNTFNLNLNSKLSRRLTLAAVVNYLIERAENRPNLSDSPGNSNWGVLMLPNTVDINTLKPGWNNDAKQTEFSISNDIWTPNPWFASSKFINNTNRNRVISMASLRYDMTDWLYLQGRIGQDFFSDRATAVTPTGTAYRVDGDISETFAKTSEINMDFLVGAERKIVQDLGLNLTVGGNLMKRKSEGLNNSASTFNVPFLYNVENANNKNAPDYFLPRKEVQSLYYSAEFAFRNLFFLNTTGRQDWFSTLPEDNNSLFYPSVSASFVVSELAKPSWMNFAKLRLSWAKTSGDTDPYQTQLYYTVQGGINGVPLGVINNGSIPNAALQPYQMSEFEAGFDVRLLNNRLGIDFAWFKRNTDKEIVSVPASITSGYTGATLNIGELENKGIELMLTGTILKQKNLEWISSFNFTKLNNKVLKLAEGQQSLQMAESRSQNAYVQHIVGLPASQVMAFDFKRDAQGNIVYDNNGWVQQGKLIPMGSGFHDKFGGWNNELKFKNFNFGMLIDFKSGGKIFSATNFYATQAGLHKMSLEGREGGIVGNGVNEAGQKNAVNSKAWDYWGAYGNVSTPFVYDASFIKLRQIILGFTIPGTSLGKLPVQGINISLVGRNLATLKKHTENIDPESNYNNSVGQGLELAGVPPYRSFGINVNVKF